MQKEDLKKKAAEKALTEIKPSQVIGIGSGSTVDYFIDGLIQKAKTEKKQSWKIAAASVNSEEKLKKGGLQVENIDRLEALDVVIDGADLTDSRHNLVKGLGGALLREKLLMLEAERIIVMIDEEKLVKEFSNFTLAVEIAPFSAEHTRRKIDFSGGFRKIQGTEKYYLTDNNNFILDLKIKEKTDLAKLQRKLKLMPGVVETGLFLGFHPEILVAYFNGKVAFLN